MLILAPIAAMLIQMAISRTREYRADEAVRQVHRNAVRPDQRPAEARDASRSASRWTPRRLPPTCSSSSRSPARRSCAVLDASFDRGPYRSPAGDAGEGIMLRSVTRQPQGRRAGRLRASVDLFERRADRGEAQPGDAVEVLDPRGRPLGTAHYSSTSQITLRLLSPRVEEIGREFFQQRLARRREYRQHVVHDSDAYRSSTAKRDLLPALVVDRYGDYLVVQTLDQGMDAAKAEIVSCLEEIFHPRASSPATTSRSAPRRTAAGNRRASRRDSRHRPRPHERPAPHADLLHGQKTGIFLDQRENYRAAARYARGGRALDCFTSTGGFALHMAAHGNRSKR